jgi:UDP-N-acetylmuramate dehydrogenase
MDAVSVQKNYQLRNHNTFNLNVLASEYLEFYSDEDIHVWLCNNDISDRKFLVLGQGSNILFTKDYDGLVIRPATAYIEIISESPDEVFVEVASGVIWDDFVEWAVEKGFYGTENLTDIPGTVGASVVQNIGAYGAVVSEIVKSVKYLSTVDTEIYEIPKFRCKFAYRDSVFKQRLKNKTIILSVCFRLKKKAVLNTDYADVALAIKDIDTPSLKDIRLIIKTIRTAKLPDYKEIGNAGSFFKNPIIDKVSFARLRRNFPDIKSYPDKEGSFKLAAAWLIDNCGFKGFEHNGAAVHTNQALVIINKNNATGKDILELSDIIRNMVFKTYGIMLEPEVSII